MSDSDERPQDAASDGGDASHESSNPSSSPSSSSERPRRRRARRPRRAEARRSEEGADAAEGRADAGAERDASRGDDGGGDGKSRRRRRRGGRSKSSTDDEAAVVASEGEDGGEKPSGRRRRKTRRARNREAEAENESSGKKGRKKREKKAKDGKKSKDKKSKDEKKRDGKKRDGEGGRGKGRRSRRKKDRGEDGGRGRGSSRRDGRGRGRSDRGRGGRDPWATEIVPQAEPPSDPPREKILLVNADDKEEARIALLVDGRLEEVYIEPIRERSLAGNIYRGRVQNVEKGIGACFVDLGRGMTGFLHASDLPLSEGEDARQEITDRIHPGDEVLVQITRDGIGRKGPALTGRISLPGRYLVLMPFSSRSGISRRIPQGPDRDRMRKLLKRLEVPEGMGVIVRTAGESTDLAALEADLHHLHSEWLRVKQRLSEQEPPGVLRGESDIAERSVRDIMPPDVTRIVVDRQQIAGRIHQLLRTWYPSAAAAAEVAGHLAVRQATAEASMPRGELDALREERRAASSDRPEEAAGEVEAPESPHEEGAPAAAAEASFETAGSETAGSETAGSETAGSETTESEARPRRRARRTRRRRRGADVEAETESPVEETESEGALDEERETPTSTEPAATAEDAPADAEEDDASEEGAGDGGEEDGFAAGLDDAATWSWVAQGTPGELASEDEDDDEEDLEGDEEDDDAFEEDVDDDHDGELEEDADEDDEEDPDDEESEGDEDDDDNDDSDDHESEDDDSEDDDSEDDDSEDDVAADEDDDDVEPLDEDDDEDEVWVDEVAELERQSRLAQVIPDVLLHTDDMPLFHAYDVETQLEDAFRRSTRLPSGGSIVIDQTEALVAVDVNSGRLTDEADPETTALVTNLEALEEGTRQLRLRDLGGLVVWDFIDMRERKSRKKVEKALHTALSRDRARIRVGRMGPFGCVIMSRQRIRQALSRVTHDECPHCSGTGRRRHDTGLGLRIVREMRARIARSRGRGGLEVRAPQAVVDWLKRYRSNLLKQLRGKCSGPIVLKADGRLATDGWAMKGLPPTSQGEDDA